MKKLISGTLLPLLVLTCLAQAQTGWGTIQGRVSDSQQLTLPQPKVELRDSQNRVTRTVIGDGEGHYQINNVPSGTWTVQISRDGFGSVTKGPVTVGDGQTVALDAVLTPKELAESVNVTAAIDDR
jgi:hypothetical protein